MRHIGILAHSVQRLAHADCDFFVCPDNTAHLALGRPGPELALPGLHTSEVVAREAAANQFQTVGVLGTRWTMESSLYPQALAAHGIKTQTPDAQDREAIQEITFGQLVKGVFTEATRERFIEIITKLRDSGCDAVALVGSEFPLLISPSDSPLPTLSSTDLLAQAAMRTAIDQQNPPTWRDGSLPD